MHTALISLVLMCGACGDAGPQTTAAMKPAVVCQQSLEAVTPQAAIVVKTEWPATETLKPAQK
jgi:hypothetical protein